jgi:hypothetical protein
MRGWMKIAALGALLAFPVMAEAQATANATASANAVVLAQLAAEQVRDLEFGDLIPGFGRTVAADHADAAQFRITGAPGAQVSIGFDLPSVLTHTDATNTLGISFGAGSAGQGPTAGAIEATFDPSAAHLANLPGGNLYVSLGGAVSTADAQVAGAYSATVTMNVVYTGN